MTNIYNEAGKMVPVTLIEAGPCHVIQVKTKDADGYSAIQIGFGTKREKLVSQPDKGKFKKAGVAPARFVKEIRVDGGMMLKRLRPAPQGRAHRIRKRSNHVTIVLGANDNTQSN